MPLPVIYDGELVETMPLTLSDYEAVKRALIKGRTTDIRNLMIVQILFGTGLRISEILRLTPERIDSNGPETSIWIQRAKKRKKTWERLPLHAELGVALRAYCAGNQIIAGTPIFGITARQVQRIIKESGQTALGRNIHPKMFRRLYAKTLLDGGLPVAAVANMLGHENSRITEAWYYDLTQDQRYEINKRLPV